MSINLEEMSPGSTVVDDLEKGGNVFVNDWKDIINEELKQGMMMLTTHSTIYLLCSFINVYLNHLVMLHVKLFA